MSDSTPRPISEPIQAAAAAIAASRRLVVLSGAGISRESGIPTYREALTGLWAAYDPQQLATPHAFRRDPKLVWDWYMFRRAQLAGARPNPGHRVLSILEDRLPHVVIVTQNIDGLHQDAGSTDVIELHGNIRRDKCFDNCQGDPTPVDIAQLDWDREAGPPPCPHCGALVRPAVVWFHETLPGDLLERATSLCRQADVLLVVGTSGVVQPAAQLPFLARESGAIVIEVNPDRTPITRISHWHLDGPAGQVLPQVLEVMEGSHA